MSKRHCRALAIYAGVLWGLCACAQEAPGLHPFQRTWDFEDGQDPYVFWTSYKKPYDVAVKGATTEQAHSGTKAFKLDVTFQEEGRLLWRIPLPEPIPASGQLAFSGYMLIGDGTTGTGTIGVSYALPPTAHSGCTSWGSRCQSTDGKWKLFEQDLVARGQDRAGTVINGFNWGVKRDQVSPMVESIILDLQGKKGQRVVVYVDDLEIKGSIPSKADFDTEMARRWAPAKAVFEEKVQSWQTGLRQGRRDLRAFGELAPQAEEGRREVLARIDKIEAQVDGIRKRGELRKSELAETDAFLRNLAAVPTSLRAISDAWRTGSKAVLYVVPPISETMILPHDRFVPGVAGKQIGLTAARGEYEPASFVVSALTDLTNVTVTVDDLTGPGGTIPSSRVDVKLVKCWYQAGTAWVGVRQDKSRRVLTPELLLNDSSLVKVDEQKQENYLKLRFPDGDRYVWISDPTTVRTGGAQPVAKFPVKDSATLLPVDIPKGTNQQFWLTVHVPDDAKSGTYSGSVTLRAGDDLVAQAAMNVEVLPFQLLPPYYVSSMDYHGRPESGKGTISSWGKSWEQFRAELANMVAHGLRNCQHYNIRKEILPQVLKIREEVGMDNRTLYLKGTVKIGTAGGGLHGEAKADPEQLAKLKEEVREVLDLVRPLGVEVVYFYGIDERRGEELRAQREAWKAVREAGGRVFTAGWADNIETMGDIQDLHVRAGSPSREEAARWHAYGHKVFCYANPQAGVENPVVYRRNYGILLWINDYDGAATNAYQHTFGLTWNDFDHITFRSHTIAYPTVDGVVDTIAWEGYREAVDDVRYLTTLLKAIEDAGAKREKEVASAKEFVNKLRVRDDREIARGGEELAALRKEIVRHILALTL